MIPESNRFSPCPRPQPWSSHHPLSPGQGGHPRPALPRPAIHLAHIARGTLSTGVRSWASLVSSPHDSEGQCKSPRTHVAAATPRFLALAHLAHLLPPRGSPHCPSARPGSPTSRIPLPRTPTWLCSPASSSLLQYHLPREALVSPCLKITLSLCPIPDSPYPAPFIHSAYHL